MTDFVARPRPRPSEDTEKVRSLPRFSTYRLVVDNTGPAAYDAHGTRYDIPAEAAELLIGDVRVGGGYVGGEGYWHDELIVCAADQHALLSMDVNDFDRRDIARFAEHANLQLRTFPTMRQSALNREFPGYDDAPRPTQFTNACGLSIVAGAVVLSAAVATARTALRRR